MINTCCNKVPAFKDIQCDDLANLQDEIMRPLLVAAVGNEDRLLMEVLQKHLGRLICTDDFKDCQMKFREGQPDEYTFAHKGVDLGIVRRKVELNSMCPPHFSADHFQVQYVISFTPVKAK